MYIVHNEINLKNCSLNIKPRNQPCGEDRGITDGLTTNQAKTCYVQETLKFNFIIDF